MLNRQAAGQVLRGGCFNNNQNNAACVSRNNNNPNNRNNNYGFRVVVGPIAFLPFRGHVCAQRCLLPTVAGVYGFLLAVKAEG